MCNIYIMQLFRMSNIFLTSFFPIVSVFHTTIQSTFSFVLLFIQLIISTHLKYRISNIFFFYLYHLQLMFRIHILSLHTCFHQSFWVIHFWTCFSFEVKTSRKPLNFVILSLCVVFGYVISSYHKTMWFFSLKVLNTSNVIIKREPWPV